MSTDAEQQIKAALERVSRGFGTRDPALASAPYWNDAGFVLFDIMPPFSDSGWATLSRKNEDFIRLTDGPCDLHWSDEHIEVSGDLAYFRGIAHFSTTYTDGRPMEGRFRHTLIFRKVDGDWVIVHEHSSQPNAAVGMYPEAANVA